MLTTHLNCLPYTKFVLIQDSVESKGKRILDHIIKNHSQRSNYETHYFAFEGNFSRTKSNYWDISCHDFTSNSKGWLGEAASLDMEIDSLIQNCVIVIDSLAHMLYTYEFKETYRILHKITKDKSNVLQVVAILHTDMLDDRDETMRKFQHLASLHMELEPRSVVSGPRIVYTYKKSLKKVINEIEEYHFENDRLITESIKKPDKQKIEETIQKIIPENLSTFKISLSDKDKESRKELVLPYLPKADGESSGGNIHYTFDEVDDWDEEDPDDDLDI